MNSSGRGRKAAIPRGLIVASSSSILLFVVSASALAQSVMTHHVRAEVTSGQARFLYRLAGTQTMHIDVMLPLRDPAGLDSFLQDVYDPTSPNYHHFLTVEQFSERFGPSQQDRNALIDFAKAYGFTVKGVSGNGVDVILEGSVTSVEAAFNVSMGVYQHPTENRTFFAPDREPTAAVGIPLWHVSGLDNFSIPQPLAIHHGSNQSSNATTGSGPSASFLGSDMRAAYYGGGSLNGSGQYVGLLEYLGTDLADLNTYYANIGQTPPLTPHLISTDGSSVNCVYKSCDDTEQTLDMTQALGMAPGMAGLYMFIGNTDSAILNAMASTTPLAYQLSSSWTWSPADPSTDDPIFKEFAAQGQSFYQAAGDSGKYGTRSAVFPADDPNVISVGGTDLQTTGAGGAWASETAWVDGGGGISPDRFAIPSWQKLSGVITSANKGSTTYRNSPDVSANANFTYYVCADQTTCTANEYGGTSFAAPLWAGYTALANQQAVSNATSTLGFINPAIYAMNAPLGTAYTSAFHDITSGSNGDPTEKGYDLATGWGSMNGAGLITALVGASSTPSFSLSATSVSAAQGSNTASSTITATPVNGFNSSITLTTTTTLPTGVTASYATNPITNGSYSTSLTFTVAPTAAIGSYAITVSGTGGSVTQTATFTLTITSPPGATFTLSPSVSSISVNQGKSGSLTITSTPSNGFYAPVSLSASGVPSGVTVSFNPTPIATGSGSSTMSITVSSRASTGSHTITITGTGGGVTKTTTITLTVARASGRG